MDAIPVLLRAFYIAASLLIAVIQAVPALRTRFLAYGPRATSPSTQSAVSAPPSAPTRPSSINQLLDYAATIQVPHSYFTHFYVFSVASSLFWGWWLQIWSADRQLQVVWGLMLLQGARRMFESSAFTSNSQSRMWFAHWLLGLVFYLSINVAIWIEGSAGSMTSWASKALVPTIISAHVLQHSYHAYLYGLRTEKKGYQLPTHPIFSNLLCPHYTCEVAIYFLLSFLGAPAGKSVNWTLICATVFVAVNLGVTAIGTKDWSLVGTASWQTWDFDSNLAYSKQFDTSISTFLSGPHINPFIRVRTASIFRTRAQASHHCALPPGYNARIG